jgi:cell division septation protein DedD
MEDKNLQDIKIDDLDNPKKTQLKNILTLLALLFIILVISIVITKLILGDDDTKEEVTNHTIQSQPLITSDENNNEMNQSNDSNISAPLVAVGAAVAAPIIKAALKERNVTSRIKTTLRDHRATTTINETKKTTTSTPTPKKVTIRKERTVVKQNSTSTPTKSINTTSEGITQGYYIKVGTYRDTSTAIEKIEKTKLNYKLINTKDDKTMTRVLIGPFENKTNADKFLGTIQNDIAPGAYITRMK